MPAHAPILVLDRVGQTFPSPAGPVDVLKDVNLRIMTGDFAALTGPSGSGKTTLLHLAALLAAPSAGRVLFEGLDTAGLDEATLCRQRSRRVGMVFQQFHLLPHRSVLDNVLFRFRYVPHQRHEAETQARAVLRQFGLDHLDRQPARVLSGGEMQRLAIARAVVVPPALLIADEPTGNLDAENADLVMRCFRQLHAGGLTVLMATHNLALLDACTRRFHCERGALQEAAA